MKGGCPSETLVKVYHTTLSLLGTVLISRSFSPADFDCLSLSTVLALSLTALREGELYGRNDH